MLQSIVVIQLTSCKCRDREIRLHNWKTGLLSLGTWNLKFSRAVSETNYNFEFRVKFSTPKTEHFIITENSNQKQYLSEAYRFRETSYVEV